MPRDFCSSYTLAPSILVDSTHEIIAFINGKSNIFLAFIVHVCATLAYFPSYLYLLPRTSSPRLP